MQMQCTPDTYQQRPCYERASEPTTTARVHGMYAYLTKVDLCTYATVGSMINTVFRQTHILHTYIRRPSIYLPSYIYSRQHGTLVGLVLRTDQRVR